MRTLHQFRDADRILQGLLGGGLLAKGQSILFETFPPSEQGIAQAVFGVSMISGPAIGPTLGGYLTDTLGWRWIFFANLPVGILAVLMAIVFLPADRPQPANVARVDWWGIALLTIALGSLQTFLEEGESENWFESQFVVTLLIAAMIGLALFIWRELSTRHPAVDLRVLRYRSLAAGSLFSMVVGVGLYGTLFVLPIYAQTVLHFTAMQSQGTDATTAHQQALALLSQTVDLQATLLAFEDMFRIVGWVFICCLPLVLLLGKGKTKPAPGGH